MKIVIIPEWLKKSLDNAKLDYDAVLSLKELLTILSLDDVSFYLYINDIKDSLIGEIDFSFYRNHNFEEQLSTLNNDVADSIRSLRLSRSVRPLADKKHALINQLVMDDDNKSFGYSVKLLNEDTIAIFPYLLNEEQGIKNIINVLDDLIKTHLIVAPLEEVSKSKNFSKYVNLLSNV